MTSASQPRWASFKSAQDPGSLGPAVPRQAPALVDVVIVDVVIDGDDLAVRLDQSLRSVLLPSQAVGRVLQIVC